MIGRNEYLINLCEKVASHRHDYRVHENLRHEIIEKYGTDSDQYRKWSKKMLELDRFTYNVGEMFVVDLWFQSENEHLDYIVVRHYPGNMKQFVESLKLADINEFVIVNTGDDLLHELVDLLEIGCTVVGCQKIHYNETDDYYAETVDGLKIKLN